MNKNTHGWALIFFMYLATLPGIFAASLAEGAAKKEVFFAIDEPPTPGDWQVFMQASPAWRQKLWGRFASQGKDFASWHWGWRLAWLRTCRAQRQTPCADLLAAGLKDVALVVRAEAAESLGDGYAGQADAKVLELLSTAYRHPGNERRGKPLYVQRYILFAIHRLGGTQAQRRGEQLAARYPSTKVYWQKLARPG